MIMDAVVEVFKSRHEKKLRDLYYALDIYFGRRSIGVVSTPTGFYSMISSIVPLLFQCSVLFRHHADYSKKIKLPNAFKKL